jgi:hypothetical protein
VHFSRKEAPVGSSLVPRYVALVAAAAISACASTASIKSEPLDAGVSRTFEGSYDRVLRAARDATVAAGLAIDSYDQVNAATAVIVGKKGASAFSWGELVRVVVQQTDSAHVTVRVYTARRVATNITARGDYSTTIFQNIELGLK